MGEEAKRLKTHGSPSKVEGVVGGLETASTIQQSHPSVPSGPLSPTTNGELAAQYDFFVINQSINYPCLLNEGTLGLHLFFH